jgi:aldose 1-epimerase
MFQDLPLAGPLVTLRDGTAELVVAPVCGARIAAYRVGGRDVLRPATGGGLATGFTYGFSAFPLLPYSGPIFGDGFHFRGAFHRLARNVPAEPTATHGEGWISLWRIIDRSASAIHLGLDYAPKPEAFPFAWRGTIAYRLDGGRFVTEMRLENRDHRPMPAGLGFHPYFPKVPGTVLTFDATGLWPPDAPEAVDLGAGPLVPGLDFRDGRDVSPIVLDRCYEGWNGVATLAAPDGAVTVIEADPVFGKLQVYDAWDYPYICVEPVTNANDGFNRAAHGVPGHAVAELAPGASLSGTIVIALR